jgi:hypothetical protein
MGRIDVRIRYSSKKKGGGASQEEIRFGKRRVLGHNKTTITINNKTTA